MGYHMKYPVTIHSHWVFRALGGKGVYLFTKITKKWAGIPCGFCRDEVCKMHKGMVYYLVESKKVEF